MFAIRVSFSSPSTSRVKDQRCICDHLNLQFSIFVNDSLEGVRDYSERCPTCFCFRRRELTAVQGEMLQFIIFPKSSLAFAVNFSKLKHTINIIVSIFPCVVAQVPFSKRCCTSPEFNLGKVSQTGSGSKDRCLLNVRSTPGLLAIGKVMYSSLSDRLLSG